MTNMQNVSQIICIYTINVISLYQENEIRIKNRDMEITAIISVKGVDLLRAIIIADWTGNSFAAGYLLAQGNELRRRMQSSVVEFWFSKKDGSIRHAFGTTMPSLAKAHTVGGAKASIKVIPFFDVEIGAWRSCQIQSLIKVC